MDEKQVLSALAKLIQGSANREHYRHDLPTGFTLGTNFMLTSTGIFGTPGLNNDIFSTRIVPQGALSALPAVASRFTEPLVPYLTGFTAGTGDNQNYPCDDPPYAGEIKSCLGSAAFGRIMAATRPLQMDAVGELQNQGVTTDLRIINDPLMNSNFGVPSGIDPNLSRLINNEALARFYTLGHEFEQRMARMTWSGSTANNSAGGGYQEFNGFESLVSTGHTDFQTGDSCPSLDSDIKDFNYTKVNTLTNALQLFQLMQMVWRFVQHNARRMNMLPAQWAWFMPADLFQIVTDYWPVVYAVYGSTDTAFNNFSNNTDAMTLRQMSDSFFNEQYLLMNGQRIPVVVDDGMTISYNGDDANVDNPCALSDIFLIPLTVKAGRQVTYYEYFNFAGPGSVEEALRSGLGQLTSGLAVSDGGRWMWNTKRTGMCVQWEALIRPRLRLDTPHLAGRIQNIQYCPIQHLRQPFTDDEYNVDGGVTSRTNTVAAQ